MKEETPKELDMNSPGIYPGEFERRDNKALPRKNFETQTMQTPHIEKLN